MKLEKVDVVYKLTTDGKTYYPREKGVLIGKDMVARSCGDGIEIYEVSYNTLHRGYYFDLDTKSTKTSLLNIKSIAEVDDENDMLDLIANNPEAAEHLMALAHMQWVKGGL
jgi:hypothetical protein